VSGKLKLIHFFKEHNGKRAMLGIALLGLGGWGYITAKDATLTGVVMGLGATLLGLTTPKLEGLLPVTGE